MYLAGLIADDERMTREDLQRWAEKAYARVLAEAATVAWCRGRRSAWLGDGVEMD